MLRSHLIHHLVMQLHTSLPHLLTRPNLLHTLPQVNKALPSHTRITLTPLLPPHRLHQEQCQVRLPPRHLRQSQLHLTNNVSTNMK